MLYFFSQDAAHDVKNAVILCDFRVLELVLQTLARGTRPDASPMTSPVYVVIRRPTVSRGGLNEKFDDVSSRC